MKKYEILYDWPIAETSRLSDSYQAEEFASTLSIDPLDEFTKLTERMRGLGADLVRSKADRSHFGKWDDLDECIQEFENQFNTFPGFAPRKFRVSVSLAKKLALVMPPLDSVPIDENLFEIRDILTALPMPWFSAENSRSFVDSIAIFSSADLPALQKEIEGANISPALLFHLLAALNSLLDVPTSHAVLIKKLAPPIDTPAVDAFARLMVLATGKPVHSAKEYLSAPTIIDRDVMLAGAVYHQWNDVFDVLSEYNSRQEVLTKYLTLYHVIENLMFKLPIVELETQKAGRMFSIRDFRRLYKLVEDSESVALKRLLQATIQLEAKPGVTFEQHIIDRWNRLVPGTDPAEIERALGALDVTKNRRSVPHAEFPHDLASNLSRLIYSIRNAIVHNKETEFHLTYATLDNTICILIEAFLIPCLEEISFALVGSPNSQVWYSNKIIQLYE